MDILFLYIAYIIGICAGLFITMLVGFLFYSKFLSEQELRQSEEQQYNNFLIEFQKVNSLFLN